MALMSGDTIFAPATAPGRAALAIVRLSGPQVRFALETLAGSVPEARRASLRAIRSGPSGDLIDRGIVLFFPAPASQTGEDCAEFQVHGGRAVVAALVKALGDLPGLRAAEPGEFAQRALLNGRMDLLDLEALADLIDSETEFQRQQATGSGLLLREVAERWRQSLLDIRADLEAAIDFSDEDDVARGFVSGVNGLLEALIEDMRRVLSTAARGERMRDGYRVALMGEPNSGKSSLLNVLAGRDVAIVSDKAGTTRDRIDVFLDLGGFPVVVSDTAGVRESSDEIEREGIRRSFVAASEADLILWLHARDGGSLVLPETIGPAVRIVETKGDLANDCSVRADIWATTSVLDRGSIDRLIEKMTAEIARIGRLGEPALITRERQRHGVAMALTALRCALSDGGEPELCAESVRRASVALERLLGRLDVEDVLGAIFSRFCIGK
ncbi:MAG: tRNA uridine-5-carboxymethylaminomethyl(34) synthesis GTPase MnmE [Proteobacteria bacterium]|nr:tRNA uridine-5-carboxymethylaminomethyl(34) synthesis GTPase MnmE [Pseudomonadota bacterium]